VAIKLFKKNVHDMSERERRMYQNEVSMQESTLHDNLIAVASHNPNSPVENPQFG